MKSAALRLTATAVMLASGCAGLDTEAPPAPESTFAENARELRAITQWEMRGRIAIDTGSEARQGRFTWWQDGESLRLNIRGPLNAGAVEIRGDADSLTVRSRRETRTLSDPELQLSELLGWWLPVTSLPNWLLGLPDPRFPDASVVDGGRMRDLQQRAWAVRYSGYERHGSVEIPAGMTFSHSSLELVVTVDDWSAGAGSNLELDGGARAQ
jgi:outer membrane lipoprotein LolB